MKEHKCCAEAKVHLKKGVCSLLSVGISSSNIGHVADIRECALNATKVDMFFIKGKLSLVYTLITAVCLKCTNRM